MDKMIKQRLLNTIKSEAEYILDNTEIENQNKLSKIDTLLNLKKIIDNYDELEPVLSQFFREKAKIKKLEQER